MIFANREDAGKRLAAELLGFRNKQPVILGIPRGGLIVAAEVAKKLDAPLDLIIPLYLFIKIFTDTGKKDNNLFASTLLMV